jgi:hypothetical protein
MSGHTGFMVKEMVAEQDPFKCFGYPCQFSFNQLLHVYMLVSSRADSIGPLQPGMPSKLKSPPPIHMNYKNFSSALDTTFQKLDLFPLSGAWVERHLTSPAIEIG